MDQGVVGKFYSWVIGLSLWSVSENSIKIENRKDTCCLKTIR